MTTNRERDLRFVVGYKTDTASANAVIQQNQKVRQAVTAELGKTAKAVASVEDVASRLDVTFAQIDRKNAIRRITDDAIDAGKKAKDWAAGLELVEQRLSAIGASDSEIKQVAQSIADAQAGGRGARRVGGIGSIGREIRALPAIGLGGNLSTDAIGKILYSADAGLTALGATAAQVGAASLIAAPAIIGVAIALDGYTRSLDKQKSALTGALQAQDRYYQALGTFTTRQAEQELASESDRLERLRQQRTEVQTALDSAFSQAQAAFSDPIARVLDGAGQLPTTQLRDQLKTLDAAISSTTGYTARLTEGIRNLAFSSNDTADAVERAVNQFIADEKLRAQVQVDAVHMRVRADSMTADARAARQDEIRNEISVLELYRSSTSLSWRATSQLNAEITALTTEAEILRSTFGSAADAVSKLAAAGKLLEDSADQQLDATEKYVEANEAVFKAQQEISEYSAESAQKRLDLETDFAEKRQELLAENDERETEIVEDGAEKRAKILKDFNNAYIDAVGERDALAGRQLQKKAQEDLEEQDKAQKKQVEQLERAESKKLQSYQKQFDKQYAQLMNSINNGSVLRQNALARANVDAQNAAFLINATQQQYASAAVQAYNVGYLTSSNYIAGLRAGGQGGFNSGTALPPVTGTAANTTINVGGGMTAAQLRSIIQRATGRSGGSGI